MLVKYCFDLLPLPGTPLAADEKEVDDGDTNGRHYGDKKDHASPAYVDLHQSGHKETPVSL